MKKDLSYQEQMLMARIQTYYTTSGKMRDLLDACEEYLAELEEQEYIASRSKFVTKVCYKLDTLQNK